jgi:uncharacterized repeat protein (TIGR01451 family)
MRRFYLAFILFLLIGVGFAEEDEDDIISEEFALYAGEGVKIGDYRVELIDITSLRDGLIEVKVWKRGSEFEDWRVLEENRDADFDDGGDHGGLTLTVIEIYDKYSAKLRAEYREDFGFPRKYITEAALAPQSVPDLEVEKSFDVSEISLGDEVKVTIVVKNVGNDTAFNIEVHDQPPLSQFVYVAGYPPKIKSQLDPGESDTAVYIMDAAKEGVVKVSPIVVTYTDAKENINSDSSSPFSIIINPKRKPSLEIGVDPIDPIKLGGTALLNVTLLNTGEATAYRLEIYSEMNPSGGIEVVDGDLGNTYFEIAPGAMESYSVEIKGRRSGDYAITLKASYQSGDEVMLKEKVIDVTVLEREYKYLYYLSIIPVMILAVWVIRRYKEYKY